MARTTTKAPRREPSLCWREKRQPVVNSSVASRWWPCGQASGSAVPS